MSKRKQKIWFCAAVIAILTVTGLILLLNPASSELPDEESDGTVVTDPDPVISYAAYVSPVELTEETRVCPDTLSPREAVQIYAREYTQKQFVGAYIGSEDWGEVTEYTAIRPELVCVTARGDALLGRYEYAAETANMENFYPVDGLDLGLAEFSDKIYSSTVFILAKSDGYWHLANHGSDCWLDETLGLQYYTVPFEKRTFRVEGFVTGENNDTFHEGLIYKTGDDTLTEKAYLNTYGKGTYTIEDGNFTVTDGEHGNWTYEDFWMTAEYHPEGGSIYVSGAESPDGEVAVSIEDSYTEFQIHSGNETPQEYRLYEILREGKDGEGDLREYWLGYFNDSCQHIFYVGWDYAVTEIHKVTESLNLAERVYQEYWNGTAVSFSLQDEESGKEIPLYPGGGYADYVKAIDENHYVFYLHGRNHISDAYHVFPQLLHLTRTSRDSEEFQETREEICFALDQGTIAGKEQDCILSEIKFTEEGVKLITEADPENPMSFYAAYCDAALTKISFDEQQNALRLHLQSGVKLNEEMISQLSVPETHPYIEGFAVERRPDGTDILLYLTDAAKGYYGITDSQTDPDHPVLELRLTDEEGNVY